MNKILKNTSGAAVVAKVSQARKEAKARVGKYTRVSKAASAKWYCSRSGSSGSCMKVISRYSYVVVW